MGNEDGEFKEGGVHAFTELTINTVGQSVAPPS